MAQRDPSATDKCSCTDVIIVGNGPSAISLSYLLHGYRPYYNGNSHSNFPLISKLQDSKASIVEQDLEYLSEGLEGRSTNPVALLWDAITHPDADLGVTKPPLVSWKHEPGKAKSHIVLGKMKAGGSWQRMEGSMQTLSQSGWMELPDLPFRQWIEKRHKLKYGSGRATTGDVRDYYEEYVATKGLSEHFRDHHIVTSIQKVFNTPNDIDCESGEVEPCCQNVRQVHEFLWEVRGYRIIPSKKDKLFSSSSSLESDCSSGSELPSVGLQRVFSCSDLPSATKSSFQRERCSSASEEKSSSPVEPMSASTSSLVHTDYFSDTLSDMLPLGEREEFCYVARSVVLATGTYDIPNRLGVLGEKNSASVLHSLCAFEQYLSTEKAKSTTAPVCVVGAGLSAADAILMALEAGVPVIHVFRCSPRDPGLIFRRLPETIYPEYHRVAQLMRGEMENELYRAYPFHRVVEIGHDTVLLKPSAAQTLKRSPSPAGSDTSIISIDVSLTVVMIGSRPDLTFLKNEGRDLGVVPKWPIDSKHNPVDVDPYSYQSVHESGLYAMGPLIGDNFVRFGIGGALGITNHMFTEKENL